MATMSNYESDYEDPYKNYSRLQETYDYLQSLALGRGVAPGPRWFKEHIEHIKVYLNVLEITDDRDQRPADLMRSMISEYAREKKFNLEYYLLVCDKLIEIVGDMGLEDNLAAMGF
jgi:hypothetical protein